MTMVEGLHSKYTTSASMIQIKYKHKLTNGKLASKLKIDVKLVDRWIKGVEQIKFSDYKRVIDIFSEMKGRIDYV